MKLTPLMTYTATLNPPQEIGPARHGNRMIFEVTGGQFQGDKLKGKFITPGADWLIVDAEGIGHLDVRATMKTDDGALIYLNYYGVLHINEKVQAALGAGGSFDYGETDFFTAPRFETSAEKYKWLNGVQAVSQGRVNAGEAGPVVEYRVMVLEND